MINIYGIYFNDQIIYVGQTNKKISYRWSDHKSAAKSRPNACPKLYAKINKYTPDCFKIKLLMTVTKDDADSIEQLFIQQHNLIKEGCNVAIGGRVNRGMKRSNIQKQNISILSKERYHNQIGLAKWNGSKEQKSFLSQFHRNKIVSENTKEKLTIAKSKGPYMINLNGEVFETLSINKFAKHHNLNAASLRRSLWYQTNVISKGSCVNVSIKKHDMVG